MKLNPNTANQIAASYNRRTDYTGKTELDRTLAEVIKRHGGLASVLTPDALRDLILTLGENRRTANEFRARLYRKNAAVRAAQSMQIAAE